jgi:antitoxin component YwqK of YwqJK toxin-antitoxin module
MKYLHIIMILVVLLAPFRLEAAERQTNRAKACTDCNTKNAEGNKEGLWIEDSGQGVEEAFYRNGIKEGVYKQYNAGNGRLLFFGEYKNGLPSGTWYMFDESSHLIMIEEFRGKNGNLTVKRDDGKRIKPKYKAYLKIFHNNGVLKEEGIALYYDSPEIDFFKKGKWYYYDVEGKLLVTSIEDGRMD